MRQTLVRWTCDRCAYIEETVPHEQPEGWLGFSHTPEECPPSGEQQVRGHLCTPCAQALRHFLSGKALVHENAVFVPTTGPVIKGEGPERVSINRTPPPVIERPAYEVRL